MSTPLRVATEELEREAGGDRGFSPAGFTTSLVAELAAAVTMLTRFPIRGAAGETTGAAAFGIVGGLLGLAGMLPLLGLGGASAPVAAILAIAVIAIVSGAIHLDGLADTADAMMAVGPDGAERARSDPSVGVGGVVALVLVLAADVTSLAIVALEAGPFVSGIACVAAGAVSRVVPVVLAGLARSHAGATGLGGWFVARTTIRAAWIATGSALLVILAAGVGLAATSVSVAVVAAAATGGLGGLVIGIGLVRLRKQLDGDLLGASVELSFALTVVVAAVLVGSVG